MGRSDGRPINRMKVERAYKEKGLMQKDLADLIGMSREQLSRALRIGRISAKNLDDIGFYLDLMPEYLSDPKEWDDFFPKNYEIHLLQTKESDWISILRWIWVKNGFNPKDLDHDIFWSLYDVIKDAVDNKLTELKENGLLEDYKTRKKERENVELQIARDKADYLYNYIRE